MVWEFVIRRNQILPRCAVLSWWNYVRVIRIHFQLYVIHKSEFLFNVLFEKFIKPYIFVKNRLFLSTWFVVFLVFWIIVPMIYFLIIKKNIYMYIFIYFFLEIFISDEYWAVNFKGKLHIMIYIMTSRCTHSGCRGLDFYIKLEESGNRICLPSNLGFYCQISGLISRSELRLNSSF